jgi:hypothetical protein
MVGTIEALAKVGVLRDQRRLPAGLTGGAEPPAKPNRVRRSRGRRQWPGGLRAGTLETEFGSAAPRSLDELAPVEDAGSDPMVRPPARFARWWLT